MTAVELVEQVAAAGGSLTLTDDGKHIRAALPEDALALVDVLRERKPEVIRLLRAREMTCYIHGERAKWWNRPDGSPVCGLCHPDPYTLAVKQTRSSGPPEMPAGVRLLDWKPKQPPVAITTWAVVNDVPQFVRATFEQLRAALDGKNWRAGNWSVRELVDRLEQCGVQVEVTR
jgi:hypothetical protein